MTVEDSDISRIEGHLARIEGKIDLQEQKFISRIEYEARHGALLNDFSRLELEQKRRDEKRDIEVKELRDTVGNTKSAVWQQIALAALGLVTGGGIVGILNYIHILLGK